MVDHQSLRTYVLPNAMPVADERLRLLGEIFDPASRAALTRTGLRKGWSCWDVGAGAGTLSAWLAEQVGPTGRVLATDIDPRYLTLRSGGVLEVRRHDIVDDPLPDEAFDLVHCRLLLCHLSEREAVLDRLIAALKPGGWLVIGDFDAVSAPVDAVANPFETPLASMAARREFFARSGLDQRLGRRLAGMFLARGLADVHSEGRVFMSCAGTRLARFQKLTLEQVREGMLREGLVSAEQFARDLETIETGFMAPTPVLWNAIGRKS